MVSLVFIKIDTANFKKELYKNNINIKNNVSIKNEKSVILIILDEYASPIELNRISKNKEIFYLSNYLKNKGFEVKDNFFSFEIETIRSIGSMFNYNISNDEYWKSNHTIEMESKLLLKSTLADSLYNKNVNVINLGLLDLGKYQPKFRIYFYPKNIYESILYMSSYKTLGIYNIKENKLGDNANNFDYNYFLMNRLIDSLRNNNSNKTFTYCHIMMPHEPMYYKNEFQFRKDYNLKNYTDYWKFTNIKVKNLIDKIIDIGKYKVIISGDHGFRNDKIINSKMTFSAYYGFDSIELKNINSVQDIGSLINNSFIK
jgi:hypothetical protein